MPGRGRSFDGNSMETLIKTNLSHLLSPGKEVCFLGIGGVGMSALARVLAARGLKVRGYDSKEGGSVQKLRAEGIPVITGHRPVHLSSAEWVVYSSAISKNNPEFKRAEALELSIYHRAEVLAHLMNQAISLAITGTHGKTTCSALASFLLTRAGFEPTCLVGGELLNYGSNVILGRTHLFVAEVDESDRSQLFFTPDFALITNLEADHLDVYHDLTDLKNSFRVFLDQIKKTGKLIYCFDDPNMRELISQDKIQGAVSYGMTAEADYYAHEVSLDGFKSRYVLYHHGKKVDTVELSVPGLHNVLNSLGVIALLGSFGVRLDRFLPFLKEFRGTARRLEVKLDLPNLLVIDDYAHHPTEVRASLRALRGLGRRTTVVFQPHRFSRTLHLAREFSEAFDYADRVVLTDIYGAGEENIRHVKTSSIYDAVKQSGHPNVHMVPRGQIIDFLTENRNPNEIVAFLGAGDIGEIANEFADRFKSAHLS